MSNPVIYNPAPEMTDGIELPAEIMALAEEMAKNTHEVWARNRMAQGWVYGPERNDAKKEHPCLIPYEQLPESEKEYDRSTALETLRLIVKLGYDIVRSED